MPSCMSSPDFSPPVSCACVAQYPAHDAVWLYYVQAVALGAAVQAGILEGSVANVMVMDIWQASLLRAFAGQQLRDAATPRDGAAVSTSEQNAADDEDDDDDSDSSAGHTVMSAGAAQMDADDDQWGPANLEGAYRERTNMQQQTRVRSLDAE